MSDKGLIKGTDGKIRCWWCGDDPEYVRYHDEEWGKPVRDDRALFEKICLEGFQSGLSWLTILRKRENFRRAFHNFDFERVARYTEKDIERLLGDAGIVRHRGKIEAVINNAARAIELQKETGTLAAFFWSFEPEASSRPKKMDYITLTSMPTSDASKTLSKDLKKRGWKFVGPTTCYAFMQAMGIVNDHLHGCHTRGK
ncbi:MAG: DNA-3-methyladenine glycosylase I [Alphaproteobacteria bacterium]|nr:DNA-3-methyladenine glycosylase I [Alphaproteobacteria bacterium]